MMECSSYLEKEVFKVVEPEGHALDDLDLVIDAFEEAGMDGVFTMGENAGEMVREFAGELLEGVDARVHRSPPPILEPLEHPPRTTVTPQLLEVVFEHVNRVEAGVEAKQLGQPDGFGLGGVKVEGIFQKQVAAPLDDLKLAAVGLPRFLDPDLVHNIPAISRDEVEGIVYDLGIRTVLPGCLLIRLPHVHGHRFDPLAFLRTQGLVKPRQALFGAVLGHVGDLHLLQVNHRSGVMMVLADRKPVNAEEPGFGLRRVGKFALQRLLVHLLYGVHVESELLGHALDAASLAATKRHPRGQPLGVFDPGTDPVEVFGNHPALRAIHPDLPEHQTGNLPGAVGEIADATLAAVVAGGKLPTATALVLIFLALEFDHQRFVALFTNGANHPNRKPWNVHQNINILLFDRHLALLVSVVLFKTTLTRRAVAVNQSTLKCTEPNV